jgi:hypothetical protein
MLSADLLEEYCAKFYGLGTWKAKLWYIGVEEAGGWEEQGIIQRLEAWKQNGKHPLENAPTFYPQSGNPSWHGNRAVIQPTWKQLIRILLVARGQRDTDVNILNYQRDHFARADGRECCIELFPLPSPNTATWNYDKWSKLPWLQNRNLYQNHFLLTRSAFIQQKIEECHPTAVIFYASTWHRHWAMIARGVWTQAIKGKLMGFDQGGTSFYVTRHPRTESDECFREIGQFLRKKHGK